MEKKEIKAGESSTLEFKETLPTESKKYLKTVVAFANSKGGRIVFGIKDDTLEIFGVDKDKIFTYMDSIANAIAENCSPTIIPDILFQTIDNKTIIIAEVYPGQNKPYYLKNEGITDGTYIDLEPQQEEQRMKKFKNLFFTESISLMMNCLLLKMN